MRYVTLLLVLLLLACSSKTRNAAPEVPPRLRDGTGLAVRVVLPPDAGQGLVFAGQDLLDAMATITGVADGGEPVQADLSAIQPGVAIEVRVLPTETSTLGTQGYRIASGELAPGLLGLRIEAATEVGAMYGLYDVAADLGIRYLHPEETFLPEDPDAVLPWDYANQIRMPRFDLRGFHEHTQHPIVMSDFLLRTDDSSFPDHLERYARWLVRNRQNALTFHLLKTVDLDAWVPYITPFVEQAGRLGIRVGPVLSFADQQQNAYKLIDETRLDPAAPDHATEDEQIRANLDRVLTAGFGMVGIQIGTSEFTKPADALVLHRLQVTVDHLREHHPDVKAYAWIHITCDLEADDGGYFYHLPLQADTDLGAFVHTTMFYTLHHPAPVYECEDFTHQEAFLAAADGQREQVFFPETAWWLGFDNNMPAVLPVTGYTRQYDIQEALAGHQVSGHVTFTTGREWTYWQYDHYLTRATWDDEVTWEDYLAWMEPAWGEEGAAVHTALAAWTQLQKTHILEENPLIYFYIAGELLQDEIGAQAGILARRPKVSFKTVLEFDAEAFAAWKSTDFDMLETMREQYAAVLDELPAAPESGTHQQRRLYREVHNALTVWVRRLEHARALYAGVIAARDGDQEAAQEQLTTARAITAEVLEILQAAEADYRYPVELLARAKPESLTAYPFGYLEQTSSGHFWTRRDDQLAALLAVVFETGEEGWQTPPGALFGSDKGLMTMEQPADPMAAAVISGFIPPLLFGITDWAADAETMTLLLAQDVNGNGLPDPGTEAPLSGTLDADRCTTVAPAYALRIVDSAGNDMGTLELLDASIEFTVIVDDSTISALSEGRLDAEIASAGLIALIMTVGGIDEAGAANLVKGVYGIDAEAPLPERLDMAFSLDFEQIPLP